MAQYNEGMRTFPASVAIAENLRVDLDSSGELTIAGAGKGIGTALREAFAAGDRIAVACRTRKYVASKAIAVGDVVYTVAGGKVTDATGSGVIIGKAVTAAAADGEVIEVALYTQDS